MSINNLYALDIVHRLVENGQIRILARHGFLDRGRGAVSVNVQSDGRFGCIYLSRAAIDLSLPNDSRRQPMLEAIDSYEPLSEAVVVVTSFFRDNLEVSTILINLS